MNDSNQAQTTRKSLAIIEQLIKMESANLEAMAACMDMPKSTTHGHLKALTEMGYVTNERGTYKPTLQFLYWGNYIRNNMDIFGVARPEMRELTDKTRESTSLVIEEDGKAIIVYNVEGRDDSKFITSPGTQTHLHTNASGKAILAHMSRKKVEAIIDLHGLARMTDRTITDREVLFEELDVIEKQGYATNHEEALRRMKSIAAPITDIDGDIIGAIAVFGPSARMDDTRFETELSDQVLEAANVIEVNYNYE